MLFHVAVSGAHTKSHVQLLILKTQAARFNTACEVTATYADDENLFNTVTSLQHRVKFTDLRC